MNTRMRTMTLFSAVLIVATLVGLSWAHDGSNGRLAKVELLAPENNDHAGIDGRGWFIDLAVRYKVPLAKSGFTLNADNEPGFQLTGPNAPATANYPAGIHDNVRPLPGSFSPGKDDRLPNLIVLVSTAGVGARSCQNLANLFNLLGVADLSADRTEIRDTWIVSASNFGVNTKSTVFVAVADDLNKDGILNDAPAELPDADGNGICDDKDLEALGVASNIAKADFFINGPVDLTGVPVVQ